MSPGGGRLPAGAGSAVPGLGPALACGDRLGSEESPRAEIERTVRDGRLPDLHGDAGDPTRVEEAYRISAEGMVGLGIGSGGGR